MNLQQTCNESSFGQWFKETKRRTTYCCPQSKTDDADCHALDKIGDADFVTIGWTVQLFSSHTLSGRNYWKIPWKMSKQFSYTASLRLKVIKYAKKHGSRAAERHVGPPPTGSVIRLWGNRKKSSFRCQIRRRQGEGNLQSGWKWDRRQRPGFGSTVKMGSLFRPRWYKKVKGLHEKKHWWSLRDT